MLIVSAGMQKSGSAYIYNIINEINIAAGYPDARVVKEKHKLDDVMQWRNNNAGKMETKLLRKLIAISKKEGQFVVKTHDGPTFTLKWMNRFKKTATIYIYRDPRDVLISAADHGKKILAEGKNHTFAGMVEFNAGFNNVKQWVRLWEEYSKLDNVLKVKYEDLISAPSKEIDRIMKHIGISLPADQVQEILHRYDKNNAEANMLGLHFNKGISERYKDELTPEQLMRFKNELGESMQKMGYEV